MGNKHSIMMIAALAVSGLSLVVALFASGSAAHSASEVKKVSQELAHLQETIRTETSKLTARTTTMQQQMGSLESRLNEMKTQVDSLMTCVRAGNCTRQLG